MKTFTKTILAIALAAAGAQAFAATGNIERAENKYVSGPVMHPPTSKLSQQAEMELAGYERVGSFKTACINCDLPWNQRRGE